MLTLSVTQVACERSFAAVVCLGALFQQNLRMLMVTQQDVLKILESDKIIDGVGEKKSVAAEVTHRVNCVYLQTQ